MTILIGQNLPIADVWLHKDMPAVLLDRAQLTCARALLEGDLGLIKRVCLVAVLLADYYWLAC